MPLALFVLRTFAMRVRQSLVAVAVLFTACRTADVPPLPVLAPRPESANRALVARGEYIVRNVAVCGGCHSSDERNPDGPLAGGHEFRDWRYGVARASNLTPDQETGLGAWSDAEIVRAIRTGVRRDGRLLIRVMPYDWFHTMSDDDALAVAHYLRSQPPVRNEVRQQTNVLYRIGKLLGVVSPERATRRAARVATASDEYGSYLANHVGLCGECHTPRVGLLQRPDKSRLLAGTASPPHDFPANPSNLTPDEETGIGHWSEADFIKTIRTGVNPSGEKLHPIMPWHQNARMTDDDLRAIYRYLRTLPHVRNVVPRKQEASGR